MTYAIGRPAHLRFTGIRSAAGLVHIAAGWSVFEGTRTRCGSTLKNDGDYYHLAAATEIAIRETFTTGRPCQRCLAATAKDIVA